MPPAEALIINLLLLGLFAVQHSVMARPWFKRWWTRTVPESVERSTFVLATSLVLLVLFFAWRPLNFELWHVRAYPARIAIQALFWIGWATVLASTFMIDHFDLFGLRQVYLKFRRRPYVHPEFQTRWLYRYMRHPIMSGFILAFWATPVMTLGHALFAVSTTGYILIGVMFEERDLIRDHGESYGQYQRTVPKLIPSMRKRVSRSFSSPRPYRIPRPSED